MRFFGLFAALAATTTRTAVDAQSWWDQLNEGASQGWRKLMHYYDGSEASPTGAPADPIGEGPQVTLGELYRGHDTRDTRSTTPTEQINELMDQWQKVEGGGSKKVDNMVSSWDDAPTPSPIPFTVQYNNMPNQPPINGQTIAVTQSLQAGNGEADKKAKRKKEL